MFNIILKSCQHKTSLIFIKSDFNVNAKGFKLNVICKLPPDYPSNLYRYSYKPQSRKVRNTRLLCRKAVINSGVFDKFRLKFSKERILKGAARFKAIRRFKPSAKTARFQGEKSPGQKKEGLQKDLAKTHKMKINTNVKSHKKPKSRNSKFSKVNRRPKMLAGRNPRTQMDNQKKKIFGPPGLISMAGGLVEELTKDGL